MKKMLLIQDDASVGKSMTRLLQAFGYEAPTWIGGLHTLEVTNGILQGLDIYSRPVEVDLRQHVLAFVDGDLKIGVTPGWAVVPILREAGILCISISTMYGELIRQRGAQDVIEPGEFKDFIESRLRAIYDGACMQRST